MAHLHQRRYFKITNRFAVSYFGLNASTVLLLSCLLWGCAKHEVAKAPAPQPSPAVEQSMAKATQPPPLALAEVNEAVKRIFKDAAVIDSQRQPNFLAGDFNGDASQDLAVFLQPASGKLTEMNQELPPWILRDPFAVTSRPALPLRIESNELLLAIVHGYGPNGWRDAQATQTYLLKNAAALEVKADPKASIASAAKEKQPRLVGDSIGGSLRGKPGYVYFNGAQYSWYDPSTFKGEVEARVTHPGMMPKKRKFDLLHPNFVAAEK